MANKTKTLIGKLIYRLPSGATLILESGKVFSELQKLRREYIMQGYKKENLKLTY